MPVEESMAVSGKVHGIKSSKEYQSVGKCRACAETKSVVVAFTLGIIKATCSTCTSIRGRPAKEGAVSQAKGWAFAATVVPLPRIWRTRSWPYSP